MRNNDNDIMAVKTSATQDSKGKAAHKSGNDNEDDTEWNDNEDDTELEAIYENDDYEYLNWNFKKFQKIQKYP